MEKEKEKFIDAILKHAKGLAKNSGEDLSKPKEVTITLKVQNRKDHHHDAENLIGIKPIEVCYCHCDEFYCYCYCGPVGALEK